MAWTNKRKIHVARGTTANIIALDNEENKLFTDGQPLFNKDRGYLGIANGSQEAKYIAPIKARTIEGWGNEIDSETGSYTLKSDGTGEGSKKANHYLFTGDSDGTYLASEADFLLQRIKKENESITYVDILSLLKDDSNNDYLQIKAPVKTDSSITLTGDNNYLSANNLKTIKIQSGTNQNNHVVLSDLYNLADSKKSIYLIDPSGQYSNGLVSLNQSGNVGVKSENNFILEENTGFVSQSRSSLYGVTSIWGNNYMYGDTCILPAITWSEGSYSYSYSKDTTYENKFLIGVPTEIKAPLTLGKLTIKGNSNYLLPNQMSPAVVVKTSITGLDELDCEEINCTNIGDNDSRVDTIYSTNVDCDTITVSKIVLNA